MSGYERWAPFYDAMRGDQEVESAYLRGLIERHHPRARTLLELGCGTGAILARLRDRYEIAGVDLSPSMLRVARAKLPGARLVRGDVTTAELGERFDVVLCVGDVVNHLRPYRRWEALFAHAHAQLEDGGVLVLDMNTQLHLSRLAAEPPLVEWSPRGDLGVLDVAEAGRGAVSIDVTVFERVRGGAYRRHDASVAEVSFPVERVRASLQRRFRRVRVYDEQRSRPSRLSERLHFVCTR